MKFAYSGLFAVLLSVGLVPAHAAASGGIASCLELADRDARLACFEAGARELKGEEERKRTAEAERKTKEFGLPSPVVRETLSSVKVRIVSEFDGWRPGATFKLDNGQVWEFIGNDSGTVTLNNNEAVIERGMLGSFFLRMEGVRSTPKVRRIR